MRFGRFLSSVKLTVLILTISVMSGCATSAKAPEPTPSVMTSETGETLTLVWQSEFSPDAALSAPNDVAVDNQGNIYVSVQSNQHIKKFDSDGKFVSHWGDSGTDEGQFGFTAGLAVDAQGNVYVADFAAIRIQKFDGNGNFLLQWPTEPPAGPASVTVDQQGFAYVDNFFTHDHQIQKFDSDGNLVAEWGSPGSGNGEVGGQPEDIAVDHNNNVYVADRRNHLIQKFDSDGNFLTQFGGEASSEGRGLFFETRGVAIDHEGNIYVTDEYFLQRLNANGDFIAQWSTAPGGGLEGAGLLAVDEQGDIYILAKGDILSATGEMVRVVLVKKFHQN